MRVRTVEISADVEKVLRAGAWNGRVFKLPGGPRLERSLYEAVDKVLRTLGGKWRRADGGHVFEQDAADLLKVALDQGEVVDQKRTFEQFFTPPGLAAKMASAIEIGPEQTILEPSAGNGRLIDAAIDLGADEELITAVEMDEGISFDLACRLPRATVINTDFLSIPVLSLTVDKVLMNPPFSRGQDMAHVRHAFEMLRPGGELAAIMSPHFRFAEDKASVEFRAFLESESAFWEPLPEGTFKESGTSVNTGLLLMRKGR